MKITPSKEFEKAIKRLDVVERQKLEKRIRKIIKNPKSGKPLKYRRGERVLYVKPFRLVYAMRKDELLLLKYGHRKNVYH